MVDVPGNTTTTSTISVGSIVSGVVDAPNDRDWYAITLTAGQSITITLAGAPSSSGTVPDTYVAVHDSFGNVLGWNDDHGGSLDSLLVFTAPTTGTYYIDAGAWDMTSADAPPATNPPNYTGTYTLSVQPYTPPPVWNYDQIANQLSTGYWNATGDTPHHFNVTQGGTITVNYSSLTAAELHLAQTALQEWSDIIGVTFTPVTTGGDIRFDDSEDPTANGPVASTEWLNTYAHVQISSSWVTRYGTGLNSYSFQTYLHEIGHALGLGHAGDYNIDASYPADALFANDAWSTSIMSYFDQGDNTYFANQGFSRDFVLTPMNGDIVAMQQLYGLSTTTRTGDTTYGFNSNAGRDVYNASLYPNVAYAIFDSGGNDTLDYSNTLATQTINLNPETFSSVLGNIGNVTIARGTIIENAIGGGGNDTIIGNDANNRLIGNGGNDTLFGGSGDDFLDGGPGIDQMTGGPGNDTFSGTKATLNGDSIMDFGPGDRIVITDATLSGFTFSLAGNTLTYTGGSLAIALATGGSLVASAAAAGGVQLSMHHVTNDFNGDGISDILWRDSSGTLSEWLGSTNRGGGFQWNSSASFQVGTDWTMLGVGDFNGDGRYDILWRQTGSGTTMEWLGQSNGSFAWNVNYAPPASYSFAGIGDFNGDGKDDIMWRDSSGTLSEWLGQANGTFAWNPFAALQVSSDWHIVSTGDFNGDGKDDLLWRQDVSGKVMEWLGNSQGGFAWNGNFDLPTSYHFAGVGDFNGDGLSDILWRNSDGTLSEWIAQGNGAFQWNPSAAFAVSNGSQVAAIGDYNGDGRDDILWQTTTGHVYEWLAQPNGSFIWNQGVQYDVGTSMHVQPSADHFL